MKTMKASPNQIQEQYIKKFDNFEQKLRFVDDKQNKLIDHLIQHEETVQMRIDTLRELVLAISDDVKRQEKDRSNALDQQIEKNKLDNVLFRKTKETLDLELQNLLDSNFALESELIGIRGKLKDVKLGSLSKAQG